MKTILLHILVISVGASAVYGALGDAASAKPDATPKFQFKHHVIDQDLSGNSFGQTALADLDGDGKPEFIMGQRNGPVYVYKYHPPERWTRHIVGERSPSDVGLCVVDADGDGRMDLIAGGAWYRNSGDLSRPFERIVFDAPLQAVHDMVTADVDADGRLDVLTMSDRNNLRWYKIPANATQPWQRHDIGKGVHAGLSVGDINGNGRLDVVRTDVWFENADGNGTRWIEHFVGPNTPPPSDFRPNFAFDATRSRVLDMNGDGRNDIVFTDGEIPGGKVWWMENVKGDGTTWKRHDVPLGDDVRRGAYHTLHVADFDGDSDFDIFSCEMEAVRGNGKPRWYIWENSDGKGMAWKEHVILDVNLGGHEAVVGDITGNGKLDIISKPWTAHRENALGGKPFVIFLENISPATTNAAAVQLIEEAVDPGVEGLACYKIVTPAATYYLEKYGAGLSSIIDKDGRNWIHFQPRPGSGSSGEWRGFPNAVYREAGNYFHARNSATDPSTLTVESVAPNHVSFSAVSSNQLWACRYDFFPTHCTFTMTRKPDGHKYWVLFEGTPGGEFDLTDWWMTSAIQERQLMSVPQDGHIPSPSWIAFGDANLDRVLFMLHHEDDSHPDRFYQMNREMTVFGFGRSGLTKFLDNTPQRFSIGFIESTDHARIGIEIETVLKQTP